MIGLSKGMGDSFEAESIYTNVSKILILSLFELFVYKIGN
jgi:hypothetical protein